MKTMNGLLQDVRFALRQLRKNPGFTAAAIIVLALGIGTTTGMLGVVQSVLLRPLRYKDPDRLVLVGTTGQADSSSNITFRNFQPGRMVQIQRSQPNWDQSLEGTVARNFFIGEFFYPYFIEEHERMLRELDAELRKPEIKPYLDGLALP